MLSRWLGGLAAAAVALVARVLVILDLTDAVVRRWWDAHALTTDTIAGLLVLMITVLVVDQVVRLRQHGAEPQGRQSRKGRKDTGTADQSPVR